MIDFNKNSNEKHIKLLNKGNNFYLTNGEVITNIYYGEKEIYKLSIAVNDENNNQSGDIPEYYLIYDSIYPVDVERYVFKTGKLDLIDVDSPKFDLTTALWIYLCWYQLFGNNAQFKEEFITKEDELDGISEEKRTFLNSCLQGSSMEFLSHYAPYNLYKKIVIYKKNINSKIDKVIKPLIKKIEKSKILFNFLKGKTLFEIFSDKVSNYDFLKNNIFIPKRYEYTDEKLHEYNFKIWVKDVHIFNDGDFFDIHINLGNKGSGFKESGFKIFLFINDYMSLEMKSFENRFRNENITPEIINNEQVISIRTQIDSSQYADFFIGIVKLSGNSITEIIKLNNKNYENEEIVWIR